MIAILVANNIPVYLSLQICLYQGNGWIILHAIIVSAPLLKHLGCCISNVGQQTLVLAGYFSGEGEDEPIAICGDGLPQPVEKYYSNAEEADIHIWRHVKQIDAAKILV